MGNRISGRIYLLLAVLIFAASNSITRQLTELGADNLIDGRNPISFCNVLFVGNLCALIVLLIIYGRDWRRSNLGNLSLVDWGYLLTVAILAGALAPALIFFALEQTAVNNVVLVGRIEPPITLALSVVILRAQVNRWIIAGAILSFVGVVLTVLLQAPPENVVMSMGESFQLGRGELMTAIGAIALAVSTVISKINLNRIALGMFAIIRTAIGTVVFFVLAVMLYGLEHFQDVTAPILWQWMVLYGAVIVVGGQLAWFKGLNLTQAGDVALANSISPLAGIGLAYLILGEVPTLAHYIGGLVIVLGIICNQVGVAQQHDFQADKLSLMGDSREQTGFKGF